MPDIVLYLSDDFGGTGDVTSVTGGWTTSSYNHNSSNVHDVSADRMRLDISGSISTGYLIGSALRSTNAVVIPTGYNQVEVKYRAMVGGATFKLSSTAPHIAQGNHAVNYTAGTTSNYNTANGTQLITIDSSIANGNAWFFYVVAHGGQYANIDFEITSIKILAV